MQRQEFSITIQASRALVWNTIWVDETFRDWASLIDEGMYMVGALKEGEKVQFISSQGYGVTSLVEKLIPGEHVFLRHMADTKDSGENVRPDEWTGGMESYTLSESDDGTTLTFATEIPSGLEEIMETRLPHALERIKVLAEQVK